MIEKGLLEKVGVAAALLVLLAAARGDAFGQSRRLVRARVKYISAEAVYVDAGREDGLAIGDTLKVVRRRRLVALLVVEHLASRSAACRVLRRGGRIRVGDVVLFRGTISGRPPPAGRSKQGQKSPEKQAELGPGGSRRPVARRTVRRPSANRISGDFALQTYWQRDMQGGGLSTLEPSLSGRLVVRNLGGTGMMLRLRHRSRLYHRSRSAGSAIPNNEWTHRLFEIALLFDSEHSPVEFGIGRVLSPHIRGIGYIDGAHFAVKVRRNLSIGVAAGTEPTGDSGSFGLAQKKYGAFLTYRAGAYDSRRLSSTLALSGSYDSGHVSREFIYIQNDYWLARRLSLYQSVEIDINRKWRRAAQGQRFTFSNLYVTANLTLTRFAALNLSFDARRNVRTYETFDTPDSLFDSTVRRGVNAGLSLRLPAHMTMRSNGGVRFGNGGRRNTVFASFSYDLRQFPGPGHAVSVRLSYFDSQFTRGYRPVLSYRFPVARRLSVNLSGGGYLYRTGDHTTSTYYGEVRFYYPLTRRVYSSWNVRRYFGNLRSLRMFADIGLTL